MRLEKTNGRIIVHKTGRQKNGIEYDSVLPLTQTSKRILSYVEDFLREQGEIKEADKIADFMGKTLKPRSIPKLIPTGNYQVNLDLNDLKSLIDKRVGEGLQLNPDFQRPHKWNMEQRIAFVEFVLQDGKAPPICTNHTDWHGDGDNDEWVLVDGKQRLTSLLMFLDNKFPVFKELDGEGIGYFAKEFSSFGRANILFLVNNLPTRKQYLQWYLQINKGNVAHTRDELQKVEGLLEAEESND